MRQHSFLLLALLAALACQGAITDQPAQSGVAGLYDNLQVTCKGLMISGAQGNIEPLAKYYAATTNAEIREAITAASGLYWMLRQRIAESDRYAEHLRKTFPGSKYAPLLDKVANLVPCTNCAGTAVASVPCPDCAGSGKCRPCSGRGKVPGITGGGTTFGASTDMRTLAGPGTSRQPGTGTGTIRLGGDTTPGGGIRHLDEPAPMQPCAICGGSGVCRSCKGSKQVKARCPMCQGAGTVFTPRTSLAYVDVLNHLRNLAFAAAQAERGQVLLDGRWCERAAADKILQQRRDERDDFARVASEAERAKDYKTALQLLDNVLARHPDSTYTGDVRQVKLRLQLDAANKKLPPKAERGPAQMAAAATNPRREVGVTIDALLEAARRGTNLPMLIASNAAPFLPTGPLKWEIGEPELIDRSARVGVRIDRASQSGFAIREPWEFRLVYEDVQWRVWQTVAP
jgi:hypothetical protein